ncbi:hypothetical protein [Streptomyces sp. NPDC094472]|uniref:hypothetical protein n=1 Tax=unclassified Streptomyces TaxID=2593676 RepID=UPI00332BA5E3
MSLAVLFECWTVMSKRWLAADASHHSGGRSGIDSSPLDVSYTPPPSTARTCADARPTSEPRPENAMTVLDSRALNRATLAIDAYAAATAVLSGRAAGVPKARNGIVAAIRALRVVRKSAVKTPSTPSCWSV